MSSKISLSSDELLNMSISRMPLVVFADSPNGLFNWAIRMRTKGTYSHVMTLVGGGGRCVSQDLVGLREVSILKYVDKGYRLKLFAVRNVTKFQLEDFYSRIEKDLAKPWWKRRYDFLGILGQAIGIRKLNISNTNYCSENVGEYLKILGVQGLGEHMSPSDLNLFMTKDIKQFEYVGHYYSD